MTVQYMQYVQTSKGFPSPFSKLLKRWVGSLYKLVYFDLLAYLAIYYALALPYRFLMDKEQKQQFETVVLYFKNYPTKIPLMFVLAFYVNIVYNRWKEQIVNTPWPDRSAIFISSLLRGMDEQSRKMRRTVIRYLNLSLIMVFRLISPRVKKRFPTYDQLVEVGVLNDNEKKIIQKLNDRYPNLPKYWMPIVWASAIFSRARSEGRIRDDFALQTLNGTFDQFRNNCILLLHYDTISVPLVYTQTVTIATYAYFLASLFANQWIYSKDGQNVFLYYFPLLAALEFVFFMGWLKVAETMICPFGFDDDDFEINATIDRNVIYSYMVVDEMHNRHPMLLKDQYWDEVYPVELAGGPSAQPAEHSTAYIDKKPDFGLHQIVDTVAKKLTGKPIMPRTYSSVTDIDDDIYFSDGNFELTPEANNELEEHENIEDFEEEDEADEADELSEGITFEKLREEREREKKIRQQNKVLKTIKNVTENVQKKTPTILSEEEAESESIYFEAEQGLDKEQ